MDPAKVINEYLKKKSLTVKKFANLCDLHYMTVYNILHGSMPSQLTAAKIEKWTKGDLKYEDLTDLPKKRRRWNSSSKFVDSTLDMLPAEWGQII